MILDGFARVSIGGAERVRNPKGRGSLTFVDVDPKQTISKFKYLHSIADIKETLYTEV